MPASAGDTPRPDANRPYRPNHARTLLQSTILKIWGLYSGYSATSAIALTRLIATDHSGVVALSDGDKVAHVLLVDGVFTYLALDPPSGLVLICGAAAILDTLTLAAWWAWQGGARDRQAELDDAIAQAVRVYLASAVPEPQGSSRGNESS